MSALDAHRAAVDLCTYCPKLCRWACPVAEAECRETSTPWALMTRVDDVMTGRAPLDAESAEMLAHCTGCGRCQTACKHGNDVATVLQTARAEARLAGVAPPAQLAWADTPPPASAAWEALPTGGPIRLLAGHADDDLVRAALRLLRAAGGPHRPPGPAARAPPASAIGRWGPPPPPTPPSRRCGPPSAGPSASSAWTPATPWPARAAWHGGLAVEHLTEALAARLPPLSPAPHG
ncbi:MAG: (Fe-S)-binding protein [Myxococcales bacterium]|nr:(Fe-S)-binding protein [Myxococcales bacterium]